MAVERASELYFKTVNRRSVYNIVHIENIQSIMRCGILCYEKAEALRHQSIAMNTVQQRRTDRKVPNGLRLHEYANAYFDPRNPMMYSRQDIYDDICVLAISVGIMDIDGAVVSDGNAASSVSRFYDPIIGIKELDFEKIFAKWWTNDDPWEQENCKRIKCAEVLVPQCIPYEYVVGAIVVNERVETKLSDVGFGKRIIVKTETFFR